GLEVEHLRDDDHNFPAYVQSQVTRDEEGRPVSLSGTVEDITEQTEKRQRPAVLADNLPSGVIFRLERDSDGAFRIVYVSAGIDRLIGRAASEVMHRADALFEVIHEEDITGLFQALEHSEASGDVLDHEFRVATTD